MHRPPVDLVVPFGGDLAALADVAARFAPLATRPGDTLTIADNRPAAEPAFEAARIPEGVTLVRVPEPQSSYVARNRGAAAGANAWIVFLDADVRPTGDLLAAYFAAEPAAKTGVLAGGVRDEAAGGGAVATWMELHTSLDQGHTLDRGAWSYAQTANCAVRREAFAAVDGFDERARSGGDADLCYRLRDAGWGIEPRADALVLHRNRSTLRGLAGQQARHGAGAAWLDARYPGAFPPEDRVRLAKRTAWHLYDAARALVAGDRARAKGRLVFPTAYWAFELGRRLSNDPPRGGSWSRLDRWLR